MRFPQIVFDFDGTLADSLAVSRHHLSEDGPDSESCDRSRILETARGLTSRQLLKQMGVRLWQLPRVVRAFRAEAILHTPKSPVAYGACRRCCAN